MDVDFAGEVAAAGASGDLGDELEGAFGGAEVVGDAERAVGGEDTDEGDIGEVEAFGNHLGAEEDVGLFGAEGGEEFVVAVAAGGGVGVHPDDAGGGEDGVEGGLDALGAEAELLEVGGVAGGAGGGGAAPVAAEVAAEGVVLGVVGELGRAVGAAEHFAAGLALEGGGVAAAVEEEDGLLAAREAELDGLDERLAEDGGALAGLAGLAHVEGVDGGEGAAADALGQADEGVLAGLGGVVPALEGGGGRAEDAAGALDDRAHHGHVAGAVARAFVLLVAAVVLFVDNHQAEGAHGGEDGRARADDHLRFAAADAVPLVVALAIAQGAVEDGDDLAEAGGEAVDRLGGEGDLRHQDDGRAALGEGGGDGLHVDLGLARAGDAEEEDGLGGREDGLEGGALRGGEGHRLGGEEAAAGEGAARDDLALAA